MTQLKSLGHIVRKESLENLTLAGPIKTKRNRRTYYVNKFRIMSIRRELEVSKSVKEVIKDKVEAVGNRDWTIEEFLNMKREREREKNDLSYFSSINSVMYL